MLVQRDDVNPTDALGLLVAKGISRFRGSAGMVKELIPGRLRSRLKIQTRVFPGDQMRALHMTGVSDRHGLIAVD
jgi:hypothetical protein